MRPLPPRISLDGRNGQCGDPGYPALQSQSASGHMPLASGPYVAACPVGCTAPLVPTRIELREGPLRRCTECGQLVSQATPERYWTTMRSFDAPDYNQPTENELARRTTLARRRFIRIRQLRGLPPRTMRLLDVGCSRGQYVAAAEQFGFRAEGVEPAPRIAAAARAQGLRVHTGLLEEQSFPTASFDAITLFEVIEHLREPLSLMRECHRILKPGGILCLSTGNTRSWTVAVMRGRWDYFDLDQDGGHVSFYNPRSLALLAERTGYTVAGIETSRLRFTERSQVPFIVHAFAKAAAELLSFPAKLMGRGHQMLAYLRRD